MIKISIINLLYIFLILPDSNLFIEVLNYLYKIESQMLS